jgi:hypothetical protein
VLPQPVLQGSGAADRRRRGTEAGHDAVAGMLDLATARALDGVAHDGVVDAQQRHRGFVAEALRVQRGIDDVGEQDGARRGLRLVGGPGHDGQPGRSRLDAAEQPLGDLGIDFDDLLGEQAVGFRVNRFRGLGGGGLHQAIQPPVVVVMPVAAVFDAVLFLHGQVEHMRVRDLVGSRVFDLVDIHVKRHRRPRCEAQATRHVSA